MDYIIYNGELYHHGVKGMKWGVRKADKKSGGSRSIRQKIRDKNIAKQQKTDAVKKKLGNARYQEYKSLYGKKGAERIYDRKMNKGMTYKKAEFREAGRQFLVKSAIATATVTSLAAYMNRKALATSANYVKKRCKDLWDSQYQGIILNPDGSVAARFRKSLLVG